MPVKVRCTNCEKVLSAPDAARGKAIKCPECQTRIAVPAEESSAKSGSKSAPAKAKAKKPSMPVDSESALATFDMRRAEDTEARICPKCGHDMKYQDEEDTECPKCGYDAEAGGLGIKARKKAMKGPDPDDFYPGLFKQSWKFVGKNQMLAWRTVAYTMVCLAISLGCAFMYLWISPWPPRVFFAFCFTISFLVIPGWMWFLDTEVIKLTLERKDKFRKLNFDFFLASAMGAAFVFWCVAVAIPLVALPAGLGYYLVTYNGMAPIVLPICIAIGIIPAVWMLPVVMSHMSMPIQYKGWLIWKVVPMWARNLKPLTVWLLFFVATNILNIAGITTIAAVYGQDIQTIVDTMEFNAENNRKRTAQIDNPNARKKGQKAPEPVVIADNRPVNYMPLIVPGVILVVMTCVNGFTCMFNMRTNAQFTYYHRPSLELVERAKERKYVATIKRDEEEDDTPKTTSQQFVEAIAFIMIFDLVGLVGGMLYGALSSAGVANGIITGMLMAHNFASIAVWISCLQLAFSDSMKWGFISLLVPFGFLVFVFQDWEQRKGAFIKLILTGVIQGILVTVAIAVGVASILSSGGGGGGQATPAGQPQVVDPSQMMQGGMPSNPGMQQGTPSPQGAHGQ